MNIGKLMLGTVQMGLPYGINNSYGKISEKDSIQILKKAYDAGIRYLDTAEAYGAAHEVIGLYHKKFPNHKFGVITKLPNSLNGNLVEKVEKYMVDLHVDQLHGILFHSYSSYSKGKMHCTDLQWLKTQGYVENFGVSVYTNTEVKKVIDDEHMDIIQFPYNIFDNKNLRHDVLLAAKQKGKTVHTRSCFLQGLFFAPVNSGNQVADLLHDELLKLQEISRNTSMSINGIALNYCLQENLIDNVVIGVDNMAQLIDNLRTLQTPIAKSTIQQINTIHIKNPNLLNPSLWNALLEQ